MICGSCSMGGMIGGGKQRVDKCKCKDSKGKAECKKKKLKETDKKVRKIKVTTKK